MKRNDMTDQAAEMALTELKRLRERFTDQTSDSVRLKLANACIRLIGCMNRGDDPGEDQLDQDTGQD